MDSETQVNGFVTENDLHMIEYFWREYGNPERYVRWPEIQYDLIVRYPSVIIAWENYRRSEAIMDLVIKSVTEEK